MKIKLVFKLAPRKNRKIIGLPARSTMPALGFDQMVDDILGRRELPPCK